MSIKSVGEKLLNKTWKMYANNLPKFTMHSTIAGWVLAIASNVFGVTIDKKIDKKEKKYLIPREIGDGVSNILLFVGMTKLTTKLVNDLVDNEKIISSAGLKKDILKSGLGVGASLLGAVVVSNVLAPIIRNTVAARSQKKFLEKQNKPAETITPITQPTQNTVTQPTYMQSFLTGIRSGNLRV